MIPALVEAALRALLVALTVGAGLRLFRVGNVLAQKAAWGLTLVAALAMPMVMRWQVLPAAAALRVSPTSWMLASRLQTEAPASSSAVAAKQAGPEMQPQSLSVPLAGDRFPAPTVSNAEFHSASQAAHFSGTDLAPTGSPVRFFRPAVFAWLIYLPVAALLLLRLFYGLARAIRLWIASEPVLYDTGLLVPSGLTLRVSKAVTSPVTIGSGVILPADFPAWDAEKLRIVLAHERSHVRQGDFYLQMLAGVHAALFWFSPLGWWLKSKLSDLGEAISDRAGLQQAASRTSYAQILLEFAALPRTTHLGVAMARNSNLSHRIERLLNESVFHKAFATSRRALLAVLLVPFALFAATAFIRVEAAGQIQQPAPASSSLTGQSHPDDGPAVPAQAAEPSADAQTQDSSAPPVPPAPPAAKTAMPSGDAEMPSPPPQAPEPPSNHSVWNGHWSSHGDSYVVVTGPGDRFDLSGDWNKNLAEQIQAARKLANGKFLLFTHDGKSYFVDDPAVADRIAEMYKPMEALGAQQAVLGKVQEEFGRQQQKLARELAKDRLPTPDMTKEMAQLEAAMATLKTTQAKNMTAEQWADFENKIGNLQGKLGDIQGKIGASQAKWGELQGKLGEQQGKLGEKQGRLGEEQGRLAEEVDRNVHTIIEESLKNGKAHPIQ
jgi:hypothetical protein